MDNITHTLLGALVGEAALSLHEKRAHAKEARTSRPQLGRVAVIVSAVANNLPDADIVYVGITEGRLGYLLHHRGHTHTIFFAIALGLIVALCAIAWLKRTGGISAPEKRLLLGLGSFGGLAHIGADSWNIYGVHPFWPFHNEWYFGDAIFIVEPTFWILIVPALVAVSRSLTWKILLGLIFAAGILLPWRFSADVPLMFRLGLIALGAASIAFVFFSRSRSRLAWGVTATAIFVVLVFFIGHVGRARVAELLTEQKPNERLRDIAMSSTPGNPFCWSVQAVSTDEETLLVRTGFVAPLPQLWPASRCSFRESKGTAPVQPSDFADSPAFRWIGVSRFSLDELRRIASGDCEAAAILRFIRVPFLANSEGRTVLGDMRFDRDEGLDFAEMEISSRSDKKCPNWVPPWTPPRKDVLGYLD